MVALSGQAPTVVHWFQPISFCVFPLAWWNVGLRESFNPNDKNSEHSMMMKADGCVGAGNFWIRLEAFKCNERGITCCNLFGAAIALGADQLFFKPLWP